MGHLKNNQNHNPRGGQCGTAGRKIMKAKKEMYAKRSREIIAVFKGGVILKKNPSPVPKDGGGETFIMGKGCGVRNKTQWNKKKWSSKTITLKGHAAKPTNPPPRGRGGTNLPPKNPTTNHKQKPPKCTQVEI